jgi:uncharacterized membrane protein
MKNCKLIACLLVFALAFMVAATAQDAPPPLTFTFKKFNVPGATATNSGGINNKGVLVGQYTDKGLVGHGFILNGTKLTKLDDPKGTSGSTGASNLALNGPIAVVGTYVSKTTGNSVGFLYKGGKFTDVPGPKGALASTSNAINDHGDIVGQYADASGNLHAYVLSGGKYTTVDPPGSTSPAGNGINNAGDMVIVSGSNPNFSAFLYTAKTKKYKAINVPGYSGSFVTDINTEGDVTYQGIDSAGNSHGVLRHLGKFYKFSVPKAALTYFGAANDHNMIVGGYASTARSNIQGLLVTWK